MLQALGNGAADCWSAKMSGAELQERSAGLLSRLERNLASPQGAVGDSQMAMRLSTLEQELQEDQRAGQSIQLGMLPKQHKRMGFALQK